MNGLSRQAEDIISQQATVISNSQQRPDLCKAVLP